MSKNDLTNIDMEQFHLGMAYWLQNEFIPRGICYFNDEDSLYTVSPYPKSDISPVAAIDLMGMADLAIRWSYNALHDIFNEKFQDKTFDQLHYLDPFTAKIKEKKDSTIRKVDRKELEQFFGVREATPNANNFLYLLSYMLWTDNKPDWEQLIGIISFLVIVKKYDPLFEEFVSDFEFVLGYIVDLPRTNSKKRTDFFDGNRRLEDFKEDNLKIYKDLTERLRSAKNYYKDSVKTEQILSCLLPFLMKCSYQVSIITCNGLSNYDAAESEEVEYGLETVTVFNSSDNRSNKIKALKKKKSR